MLARCEMLDYQPRDDEDESKILRCVLCYLCFTCSVAVAGLFIRRGEWVEAGSPADSRAVGEFVVAALVTIFAALFAGAILLGAAAIGSLGRLRFRSYYAIWLIVGGIAYPYVGGLMVRALRIFANETWVLAWDVGYLFAYPIAFGLLVLARRRGADV